MYVKNYSKNMAVIILSDYKEMYIELFNSITNAIDALEENKFADAKEILVAAQQQTEEMYISG